MSGAATPDPSLAAAGKRYVGIAVVPRRRRPIEKALGRVVECGGEALLITADGSNTPMYAGVQHIDLLSAESRMGLNRVIAVSPMRVAGRLVGKRVGGRSLAWRGWLRSRPYKAVRFYLLARLLRPLSGQVRPEDVTNILLAGVESWPIAWQLTQVNPDIEVGWDAPPEWGPVEGEPLYDPRTKWEKGRDARWEQLMELSGDGDLEKALVVLEAQNLALAEGLPMRDPAEHLAELDAMDAAELHAAALKASEGMTGQLADRTVNTVVDELQSEVGGDVATLEPTEGQPLDPA